MVAELLAKDWPREAWTLRPAFPEMGCVELRRKRKALLMNLCKGFLCLFFIVFYFNESPYCRDIIHSKSGWEHGRDALREGRQTRLSWMPILSFYQKE